MGISGNFQDIFDAIRRSDTAEAVALQQAYAGMDVRNEADNTPLHFAIIMLKADLAKKLAQNGADIDAPGWREKSPLLLATSMRMEDMAIWLVEHGANLDYTDEGNATALDHAWTEGLESLKEAIWARSSKPRKDEELRKALRLEDARSFISLVEKHGADYARISDAARNSPCKEISGFVRRLEMDAAVGEMSKGTQGPVRILRPIKITQLKIV